MPTGTQLKCQRCGRVLDVFTDRQPSLEQLNTGRIFGVSQPRRRDEDGQWTADAGLDVAPMLAAGLYTSPGIARGRSLNSGRLSAPTARNHQAAIDAGAAGKLAGTWWGRDPWVKRPAGIVGPSVIGPERFTESLRKGRVAYRCHRDCGHVVDVSLVDLFGLITVASITEEPAEV